MSDFNVSNGMPLEIWIDKYARRKEDGSYQSWSERVQEVVDGSFSICPDNYVSYDLDMTMDLAKKGVLAFSGRHLQHGDMNQKNKLGESFTNCFSADTKVSTLEYGPIELSKIHGQKVTVKARDGEWRTAVCHYHGTQTLYEYTFRAKFGKLDKGITKVVATEDHRWFLDEGFDTTKLDVGHMVAPIPFHDPLCEEAICHGLVFGDGSGHRRYKEDDQGEIIKQGVQYCSIRLCGSDKNYLNLFEKIPGASVTYHNSGDPVVYVGRKPWKDVPHTTDTSYIAGFIYGWWLADGEKTRSDGDRVVCIGTTNTDAIDWLVKFAPYAGFVITRGASYDSDAPQRIYNIKGKTGYGKPLYWIRLERGLPLKVLSKTKVGVNGVYCLEEPVTHGFMLANGMLTGNCSTALFSWTSFWLLLKGSGVGRCYDSDIHFVDWEYMPNVRFVLSKEHPDYDLSIESLEEAQHKYDSDSDKVRWFEVEDSAEGWVKIVLVLETAAFHKNNKDNLFIFDFTKIRGRGVPIRGQQGRPSSGPVPLIQSLNQVASIKGAGWKPWKQALFIDHYMSSCVAVGGVRRSARMATKYWKDRDVIEFIDIKRGGWLYTANNSITVDKEFWDKAKDPRPSHARRVFEASVAASYWDKTGEPGFINIDKLTWNSEGMQNITSENYLNPEYFDVFGEIHPKVYSMIDYHLRAVKKKKYPYIVNPCCVPGDTKILTDKGYVDIQSVVGETINIWNGIKWCQTVPFSVGVHPTLKVKFSNGVELSCTSNHKFSVWAGRDKEGRVEARNLKIGDKLWKYEMPIVLYGTSYGSKYEAYSQGFYSGDGCDGLEHSWLYSTKYCCENRLIGRLLPEQSSLNRKTWVHGEMKSRDWVPVNGDHEYCINWISGLLDADGTVTHDKNGNGLQIVSVNNTFLKKLRLMLTRLGVQAKICKAEEEGFRDMPDGHGGLQKYFCKKTWRILIGNTDTFSLVKQGLKCSRLVLHGNEPQRDARRFVTVSSIEEGETCENFCFEEKENHSGTFNGIVTGQSEIVLAMYGGYCVIGDIGLSNASALQEVLDAGKMMAKFLIRTNKMKYLYHEEVNRTNRIGVALTGIHEFAWKMFGFTFYDLLNEEKSIEFWDFIHQLKCAVENAALKYSLEIGAIPPHTNTTMKPSGTISKVLDCTEGAHLPSFGYYLRWVQFRHDHPLLKDYEDRGYPVRDISKQYKDTWIVGFPTRQKLSDMMGDKIVTAGEATPEQQYRWLQLLEKYWLGDGTNNQISYTLKYDPGKVSYQEFAKILTDLQSTVRCCCVMPQEDTSAYIYTPEEKITKKQYHDMMKGIDKSDRESVDEETLMCEGGACPIEQNINAPAGE